MNKFLLNNIEEIFKKISSKNFSNDLLQKWGKSFCPHTNQELSNYCYNRTDELSKQLEQEYEDFNDRYSSLSNVEKDFIKQWLLDVLIKPAWSKGFGIRPEWTWKNFLSKNEGNTKKYLDIGPCHGIHSNILYKEHYKGNFEFHSVDILPCYLQLQTMFGIKAKYFDASRMSLIDLYENNFVDTIVFAEVLEHLTPEEGEKLIIDIVKLLTNDGELLLSFPVDASPFNQEPFGHIHQPDIENVSKLLSNLNLRSQTRVKLWSGKTYQHVIIAKK